MTPIRYYLNAVPISTNLVPSCSVLPLPPLVSILSHLSLQDPELLEPLQRYMNPPRLNTPFAAAAICIVPYPLPLSFPRRCPIFGFLPPALLRFLVM